MLETYPAKTLEDAAGRGVLRGLLVNADIELAHSSATYGEVLLFARVQLDSLPILPMQVARCNNRRSCTESTLVC